MTGAHDSEKDTHNTNLSSNPATLYSRDQLTSDEWLALGNKHHLLGVDVSQAMVPDEFTSLLKRAEMVVSLFISSARIDQADAVAQLKADIDMAASLGAKRVRVDNPNSGDAVSTLAEVLPYAASNGVTLV